MLSIIIVNYKTRELLGQCLRSLEVHSPDAEIIVVDNASNDGSVEFVRREHTSVKLLVLEKNVGFAGANNIGIRHATGDFILLLNSDTYVEDDSLTRCSQWMKEHPDVGAASPRLIGFDGRSQPCAHPFPSFRNRLFQTLWIPPPPAERNPEDLSGWLIGAALMLRREALQAAGDFLDTAYFMYWEDTDLCTRILSSGWKLAAFTAGQVRHRGGGSSTGQDGAQKAELHSYYVHGKYHWYSRYRPRWERVGIWLLDALDVVRQFLRSVVRPSRRAEWKQARTLAGALWRVLWNKKVPTNSCEAYRITSERSGELKHQEQSKRGPTSRDNQWDQAALISSP